MYWTGPSAEAESNVDDQGGPVEERKYAGEVLRLHYDVGLG